MNKLEWKKKCRREQKKVEQLEGIVGDLQETSKIMRGNLATLSSEILDLKNRLREALELLDSVTY